MTTTRFTYVGPPAYVRALVQDLEAQGLSADYTPPYETKDLATAMAAVSIVFSVTGVCSGDRFLRPHFHTAV